MFIEKFLKKVFISFYKDENYKFLLEIKRNSKILQTKKQEFNEKKELIKTIEQIYEDYTLVYISTIIDSINQGVIPSCLKSEFKKREIEIDNVKYVCIQNKYSFYTSIYDLMSIKKEYPFEIDFLYSIFAPIDFYATKRDNYFYVLILKEKIAILGYKNNLPIYSEIVEFHKENEDIEEDIEMLDDIDIDIIEEDLSENIEEEAESLDFEEEPQNLELSSIEKEIITSLQTSIKDYYENYSDDFLEKIIFLDTIEIGQELKKLTEDELLIESEIIKFDLLKTLNQLSERENV